MGKEIVHYQAPSSGNVPYQMKLFLDWINDNQKLEKTQNGDLDITGWLECFLDCLEAALIGTEKTISTILQKAAFGDKHRLVPMNERQIKMVNLLWDGFNGKVTSSKWGKITKCSADTALRDIQDLITKNVLQKTDE
ncbi:Fic family protein [Bacteroides timonensis]|uniref:Fic family protein n=1 Tax=Bacteroides timonensis TaxID=1470345 RepID=UPI001FCC80E6|nr:Fic family protein [Bacteroides timonensis]